MVLRKMGSSTSATLSDRGAGEQGRQGDKGTRGQGGIIEQVFSFFLVYLVSSPCPMPHAQCPMPNAQCPMPNSIVIIYHFMTLRIVPIDTK
ncbi:hypothetical protein [Nostoc sp. DedQUE04]|uniref:hypothetical protein n=1 Tax=Nostoc sp. DedQUE04 TaxID=3075390 RepID=UPI002AD1E51B|nr:hypothetical protein [Nostoc sp. DedQUE04]